HTYRGSGAMQPILKRGQVVPAFTLPDSAGRPVRRSDYRAKKHLILAFLPGAADDGARAYLRALADDYAAIHAASSEALAILRGQRRGAAEAQRDLELPFPLLADADGATTARFLPPAARAGVFVTDHYGELYYA